MQTTKQSNQRPLILGILIGLALGFFVGLGMGWGPLAVTWINALPQDLSEQAKIDYVQTIAEAYAATSDLDTAKTRLAELTGPGEDPGSLVIAVLDQLGAESSSKRSSLLYLSAGIPPGSPVAPDGAASEAAAPLAPTATLQEATAPSAAESDGLDNSLSDLAGPLMLTLAGAVLILGGGYIAYRLIRSSAQKQDPFGRTHNPARVPADQVGPVFPSVGRGPSPHPMGDRVSGPDPMAASVAPPESELSPGYIFEKGYKGSSSRPNAPQLRDDSYRPTGPVSPFDAEPPLGSDQLDGGIDGVDDTEAWEQPFPAQADPRRRDEPERPGSVMGGLAGLSGLGGRFSTAFGGEGSQGGSAKAQKAAPAPSVRFSPDREGYFVAEFFAGDDFEIAKSINRGERGYVGEGGMAVSKLSTGSSADSATALEVWLFEKSQITTRTQHLLSPHLFQSDEWDRSKLEPDDPKPLEAQKGLTFRLEGEEAILHCRITDVEFMQSGPPQSVFRHLRLEMMTEVK